MIAIELNIISDVVVTLKQGSLDNPNAAVVISGKDKDGKTRAYHFCASIGCLGDLTGKILKKGETLRVVDITIDIEASREVSA